jgi:hypothetical protein
MEELGDTSRGGTMSDQVAMVFGYTCKKEPPSLLRQ